MKSELEKLKNRHKVQSRGEVFVIYGGNGWIGSQICEVLKAQNITCKLAACHVGTDSDEKVRAEMFTNGV